MKKPWQIVSVVIAFLALVFGIWQTLLSRKSTKHELGGTLSAKVDDRQVAIGESADVVVFTQDGTVGLNDVCFVPTFTNVSQYTVRDILAEYTFSGNVNFTTSDFYTSLSQGGRTVLQRNERVLYAHKQTEQPFDALSISGSEARAEIESSVTYDGAMMPFQYTTNLLVMKVAKRSGQSMEQWKQQCRDAAKRRLDGRTADLYYCTSSYVSKETNEALAQTVTQPAKTETKTAQQQKVSAPKPSSQQQQPAVAKKTVEDQTIGGNAQTAEGHNNLLTGNGPYDRSKGNVSVYYKPSSRARSLAVWYAYTYENGDSLHYCVGFKSSPNDSEWTIWAGKRDGVFAEKCIPLDVMEEDSTLLAGFKISGKRVRNRTGVPVLCIATLADGSTQWFIFDGKKSVENKKKKFSDEVKSVKLYPIREELRPVSFGNSLLGIIIICLFFMAVPWIIFLFDEDKDWEGALGCLIGDVFIALFCAAIVLWG